MTILKKVHLDTSGMKFSLDDFPIVHKSMVPNFKDHFYGTDNQDDFLANLNRLPANWIYRNIPILYEFNSSGLRMDKEVLALDDKFIAGFGCSHTLGVGVRKEDTWLYLLSRELNLDYLNVGVSGGSVKLCAINFFNMLSTINHLPSIAVFAWPSNVRYCFYDDNEFVFYLPRFVTEEKKFKHHSEIYDKMLVTDILTHEATIYRNMVKSACSKLGIQYAEFTFDSRNNTNIPVVESLDLTHKDLNYDHARDVRDKDNGNFFSHPGIATHWCAKDEVIKQLGGK